MFIFFMNLDLFCIDNACVIYRKIWYLLKKVTWQEVFSETEVNAKFKVFKNPVLHFFDIAFPLEFRQKETIKEWMDYTRYKMSSKKN
jgi:hypothetical protein